MQEIIHEKKTIWPLLYILSSVLTLTLMNSTMFKHRLIHDFSQGLVRFIRYPIYYRTDA